MAQTRGLSSQLNGIRPGLSGRMLIFAPSNENGEIFGLAEGISDFPDVLGGPIFGTHQAQPFLNGLPSCRKRTLLRIGGKHRPN